MPLLIMRNTLFPEKQKGQQSHKRTQVSQLAAKQRFKESSDQGISECTALQHGAFSSALPPQVKKLTLSQRMHWDLWDTVSGTKLGKPHTQPRLHRRQTLLSAEVHKDRQHSPNTTGQMCQPLQKFWKSMVHSKDISLGAEVPSFCLKTPSLRFCLFWLAPTACFFSSIYRAI